MRKSALPVEERLHGVQRRGADIAIYHAQRHDRHGGRDSVWTGLQTAPPTTDGTLVGHLVKFGGLLLFLLVLLDQHLSLFLSQHLVRNLRRLRVCGCVKQRLILVWLVSHNATSKWRAFQPTPQNKRKKAR